MFEIKMKARLLLKNRYFVFFMREVLSFFYKVSSFFLLVIPVISIFYSPEEIFGETDVRLIYGIIAILTASAFLFTVFSFGEKLYFRAVLCSKLEKNFPKATSFRNFRTVIRFTLCSILVSIKKFINRLIFFMPFFLMLFITVTGLFVNGNMLRSIFITLTALTAALFVLGAFFSLIVNKRYFLCDYLFCINPRMPVRSLIKTSTDFTKGKLLSIAYHSAVLLPWKILQLFPLTTPFSSTYTKACNLCKSYQIYKS